MTEGVVVWDGTDRRPWGRLLSDVGAPLQPVTPRAWIVVPPKAEAEIQAVEAVLERVRKGRTPRPKRTWVPPPPKVGPVFHARPAIWALLAQPVSVDDIQARIGGLPRHPLQVALSLLLAAGGLVLAGERENPVRSTGVKRMSVLYQRAPAYQHALSWPRLPRARTQR